MDINVKKFKSFVEAKKFKELKKWAERLARKNGRNYIKELINNLRIEEPNTYNFWYESQILPKVISDVQRKGLNIEAIGRGGGKTVIKLKK